MILATQMNDAGTPHVMENPPGHMQCAWKNPNLTNLYVYIISTQHIS